MKLLPHAMPKLSEIHRPGDFRPSQMTEPRMRSTAVLIRSSISVWVSFSMSPISKDSSLFPSLTDYTAVDAIE